MIYYLNLELINLEELYLRNNELQSFSFLASLTKLKILDLFSTKIQKIPTEVFQLKQLVLLRPLEKMD